MDPTKFTELNLLAAIAYGIFVIAFVLILFVFDKNKKPSKK